MLGSSTCMWVLRFTDSLVVGAGVETDVEIFGSGMMTEDDGSGYTFEEEEEGGDITTSSSNGSSSQNGDGAPQGIQIYLSAIKEWMIEFGDCMISMSIRTDGAWYRLG